MKKPHQVTSSNKKRLNVYKKLTKEQHDPAMVATDSTLTQPWNNNNYGATASNQGEDQSPGLVTQYNPNPIYPEYVQFLKYSTQEENNFGNVQYNEKHYNSYQSQVKPIRVRDDKIKLRKSNSMKAIEKIKNNQEYEQVPAVTMAYVEMQTTPINEMKNTVTSGELKVARNAGGKKEYEGKMARGTSISSNVWTMYHNTINNGLRPRSSLGFGKAEIRFQDQPSVDELYQRQQVGKDLAPGPGQYFNDLDKIGKEKNESYSKKGYGNGFLSRLRRFKDGKDFGYFVNIPGPGSYNPLQLNQVPNFPQASSRNNLQTHSSSVFASNVPREIEQQINESPGPAAYNIKNFTDQSPLRASLQKQTSHEKLLKLQTYFHIRKSVPSIPQFKSSQPAQPLISGLTSIDSQNPKNSFRNNIQSQTIENSSRQPKLDPTSDYTTLKILTQRVLQAEAKRPDLIPGPGAYPQVTETIAAKSIAKYTEGVMQLHVQRNREDQRKFRAEYLQKRREAMPEMELKMIERKSQNRAEPGPGAYDIETGAFGSVGKEVKSVFKSKSARELPLPIQKEGPGPAHYFKQSKIQERIQSMQQKQKRL